MSFSAIKIHDCDFDKKVLERENKNSKCDKSFSTLKSFDCSAIKVKVQAVKKL